LAADAQARASGSVLSGIPGLDIDPFVIEFFENPYPTHEALREAGPVVHLDKWNVYAVARYAEVHAVLHDPLTFCSSRGVGLSDFAKEKPWRSPSLLLEADPPAHTRTRAVLNRVLSPAVMKQVRDRFAAAAEARVDKLLARGSFDAVADLAEAYPLSVFPDAVGLKKEGREHLLPYAGVVFNAFGPPNELRQAAIERSQPHQVYVLEQCQRDNLAPVHPCRGRCRRHHRGRGAAAGALITVGRYRYHRQRPRRRNLLPRALSGGMGAAAQ
jgi:4-methoxybenzoate monooxygenase (O-demethylating)